MSKDTTVPAFPGPYSNVKNQGITKREYFAALAMQGMYANSECNDMTKDSVAKVAFAMADAMIEEGKK